MAFLHFGCSHLEQQGCVAGASGIISEVSITIALDVILSQLIQAIDIYMSLLMPGDTQAMLKYIYINRHLFDRDLFVVIAMVKNDHENINNTIIFQFYDSAASNAIPMAYKKFK